MSRRRRLAQCLAPCFVFGLATSQLACLGNGTNRIVRTAVPAGIEETLRALNDPDNQELKIGRASCRERVSSPV